MIAKEKYGSKILKKCENNHIFLFSIFLVKKVVKIAILNKI